MRVEGVTQFRASVVGQKAHTEVAWCEQPYLPHQPLLRHPVRQLFTRQLVVPTIGIEGVLEGLWVTCPHQNRIVQRIIHEGVLPSPALVLICIHLQRIVEVGLELLPRLRLGVGHMRPSNSTHIKQSIEPVCRHIVTTLLELCLVLRQRVAFVERRDIVPLVRCSGRYSAEQQYYGCGREQPRQLVIEHDKSPSLFVDFL